MDLSRYRREFPITEHKTYFNHAGLGPMSLRAKARLDEWAASALGAPIKSERGFSATVAHARSASARLLGVTAQEVAFVPSTSEGVSVFAQSLDWRVGDSVITAANEFPSNMYPWLNLGRIGVHVKAVPPAPDGRVRIDDLVAAMDSRTRVLAISWVGYNTGFRIDLARLGDECRKRGVLLFVDAIQGLGAIEMRSAEWGVAAAAAESHKWMLGTHGVGVLYVNRDLIGGMHPPLVGWRSVRNADEFMVFDFTLADDARRFEPGCLNGAGIYVMSGALEIIEEVGIVNISSRIREITDYLCAKLAAKGLEVLSPRGEDEWSGIVSFRAPGGDGPSAAKALATRDIVVTGRADFLRVSPHFYNTESEIDALISHL
jgi:selenocysteine lyase/cysteine desulfurase